MGSEQLAIPGSQEFERKDWNMGQLLSVALQNNAAIDVIERLAALREKELDRQAEVEFNEALNRVQAKIKRIAPDMENPDKHNKWATYAAIDRVIRPIYSEEGFSLSFSDGDCPPHKENHIRIVCYLSRGGHKRTYFKDMPVDTKGPKGSDVMTLTHATGASDSYAKRYLVRDIFNIAVGEDDDDGNGHVVRAVNEILAAETLERLQETFGRLYSEAKGKPKVQKILVEAKDRRKAELKVSTPSGVELDWRKK